MRPWYAAVVLLGTLAAFGPGRAAGLSTDANLVTGLDASNSIDGQDRELEFEGLARAVAGPAFLDAVRAGRHGRIGFSVFLWASRGTFATIVPWTVIASAADAERVAELIRTAARPRLASGFAHYTGYWTAGLAFRTDVSAAIEFARARLAAAPYPSGRAIANLCGNGRDNVGAGPRAARAAALGPGVTINGVALGSDQAGLAEYFRSEVAGGLGAFVIKAEDHGSLTEALLAKLLLDLVAVGSTGIGVEASLWMGTVRTFNPRSTV